MNKKPMIVSALLALTLLSGCSSYYRHSEVKDDDLVEVSHKAVERLLQNLKQPLPRGNLVVINSLVNVGDLGQTMPFGRIVSDQLSSAMHQNGYRVMGMELPTEIFNKNEVGILELPEKTKEALNNVHANALVIGTYAAGRKNVYVSLRVVEIATQNIISSTDYSIPMGPDAKAMALPPESKH
ncbi:FlgO family outer membrane protein [Methylomonas sp. SURF-2]|uniref:FlgO family outer membrane protein n=1 Tax=Methylomonas subterranea TaxID=2952225 RepID=A0ABT1TKK6_9GAMM|nr:FlgO family outer membrane protein [Methylomonas sp. SURF-2]MCQ8105617.1 FlgO family outer membrane protein [Methylomonas sp. SURF-2]